MEIISDLWNFYPLEIFLLLVLVDSQCRNRKENIWMYENLLEEPEVHEEQQEQAEMIIACCIVETVTKMREEILRETGQSGLDVANEIIKHYRDKFMAG